MEQLILYLVIIVIFSVVGYIRKAARKAAIQQHKPVNATIPNRFSQNVTPSATTNNSSQGMQDIESLLRSVLGEDTTPYPQYTPATVSPDEGRINVKVQDEVYIAEGEDSRINTYGADFMNRMMNEGVSDLKPKVSENYSEPKVRFHPVMEGFDLRKAVVYAEIMKPKFQ